MPEAPEKEAASASALKTASTVVELLKNIVLLVVIVYVCFQARAALKTVMGNVQSGKQSLTDLEVSDKTVKLKLTEVHDHLVDALNAAAATPGKGNAAVSAEAQSISAAINATNAALQTVAPTSTPQPELWVYMGTQSSSAPGSSWRTRNFNLTVQPRPGTTLQALTDVFKRNAKPRETPTPTDPDNLDLGDAVGVLKHGETVTLSDVMQIHPKSGEVDWWGRIR